MATVYIEPRFGKKGKTYALRYRDPFTGRNRHYKTYKRKIEAQQAKQELEGLIDSGQVYQINQKKQKSRPLSFREVAEHCMKDWQDRVTTDSMSPETMQNYRNLLRMLNRHFGDRLMFEISESDIKDYRMSVAVELSNVSANRRLFVIKKVCEKAVELGAIQHNPAKAFGYLSEKKHERNKYLLPDEVLRLLKASQKTGRAPYLFPVILLGADYGASLQEIVDLRWSDIDFDSMTIRFYRTKNGVERTMQMLKRSAEALQEWWEHLQKARHRRKITDYKVDQVFCRLNGQGIKSFKKSFRTACRLAHLHDFHMHDLRHTYCSNILLAGGSLKDVKELIGHKTIEMTDRYAHLDNAHKKKIQGLLEVHYAQTEI
jgi:integrase